MSDGPLRRVEHWQNIDGTPKQLGEAWRLTKRELVARCVILGHPVGQEVRVLIDEEPLAMTQTCKTTADIANVTAEWKRAFELKGWEEPTL